MNKVKIGIIGCGNISDVYIRNLSTLFRNMEVVALCDLYPEKAREKADKFNIAKVYDLQGILADDEVEIIVNLTTPQSHYSICKAALQAGKNVYVEKPLALNYQDANELVQLAVAKGLLLGCAPDTFLGAGYQTARKIIDEGLIGEVVSAATFVTCHGHENWHPDPAFFYQVGGGPLFDRGPYNLTALISLIGPVKSLMGMTMKTFETRTVTSEKRYGEIIPVEIPTHISSILKFSNNAICTMMTSFDTWGSTLPDMEIHGTLGSLILPDTNTFGGNIKIKMYFQNEFHEVPLTHPYEDNSRGLGLADMAAALRDGSQIRASGVMAAHVVEIMEAIHDSSDQQKAITLKSTCQRPGALPIGLVYGNIR